ncbi:tRNA preQ1(34) S-adenosylmethionine ribosyltransferase-isomerase QueA [Helicobacter mesocricetorum]|uniref:tRNA preQ1(34) S-adenosylmethionine ribosyltransferase-isomerase QueA n=1 Tax=Helicobacter mesocricetorum TaxID=87012 RepID=UPI000CF1B330|nr:tRNA preQ1(34) S-adenosylmethionine ribosyltransferase-isomerase QueA [Helicobacter mesocricetorum]
MDVLSLQSYDYTLPKELIAKYPAIPKESARLLVYNRRDKSIIHSDFWNFASFLPKDTLLVFNDTKVIPARFYGRKILKDSKMGKGAKIEALFHKELEYSYLLQCKGRLKEGARIAFAGGIVAEIIKDRGMGFKEVKFFEVIDNVFNPLTKEKFFAFLEQYGVIPLPPYIKRETKEQDREDYNAVFARHLGAIAAPTASLHFSQESFEALTQTFNYAYVTLHIGAGTFMGVSVDNILEHKIHKESFYLSQESQQKISKATHITAIGTTATRVVEYFARTGYMCGECDLFLHLLNKPILTQAILTNFHLPKTTLLMLVASFVGLEEMQRIYKEAIKKQYRFYSYGDGMLIL